MRRLLLFLFCLFCVIPAAAQDAQTPEDIARERIAEAAASGATVLHLSGLGLTELPPEIGNLTNLQVLDLGSLQLEIYGFSRQQGLHFNYITLRKLPPEIGINIARQYVMLDNNGANRLPMEYAGIGSAFEAISIFGNLLTELPPEIGNLKNLRVLSVSGNLLTELPPEIGSLKNLRELSVSGNLLMELPPEIGNLTALKELSLNLNQLSSLPPEIGNLINLKSLDLYSNQLSSLPPEIGNLINLKSLDLYSNQLSSLPPEIDNLINLQILVLGVNQLSSLPPEIGNLKRLCFLDLRNNQLKYLPTELVQSSLFSKSCSTQFLLDNNPFISPPPEVVQQGTAAILDYLNHQAEWHVRQMVTQAAGGIGAIVGVVLVLRWRQKRRMGKKKRVRR